ncbi:hypothetical protein JTE90_011734 [Oedothorax gibbosus]|uniref:Uncharacterized protein n=1 Tax=Oedothorax gibbosus TaxID=931172 RepID=A0AAV6TR94_9ARAC|nr:hypothetical protein JTE90_011734 [Oedothorax gibbosus]
MLMVIVLTLAALLDSAVSMEIFGANEEDVMDCIMDYMSEGHRSSQKRNKVGRHGKNWTEEKWLELPSHLCPTGEIGRRKFAANFGDALANFWGVVCDEDSAGYDLGECEKVDETAALLTALIKKKLDNKECGMAAKAHGAMKGFGK